MCLLNHTYILFYVLEIDIVVFLLSNSIAINRPATVVSGHDLCITHFINQGATRDQNLFCYQNNTPKMAFYSMLYGNWWCSASKNHNIYCLQSSTHLPLENSPSTHLTTLLLHLIALCYRIIFMYVRGAAPAVQIVSTSHPLLITAKLHGNSREPYYLDVKVLEVISFSLTVTKSDIPAYLVTLLTRLAITMHALKQQSGRLNSLYLVCLCWINTWVKIM